MKYEDIGVFTKTTTASIAAGNYGAPFTHISFLFYKSAFLISMEFSFEMFETAAGWRVHDGSNLIYIEYSNPSSPYCVAGPNDWPTFYSRPSVTNRVDLGFNVPANETIYIKSDAYLDVVAGKALTCNETISLFYYIPRL